MIKTDLKDMAEENVEFQAFTRNIVAIGISKHIRESNHMLLSPSPAFEYWRKLFAIIENNKNKFPTVSSHQPSIRAWVCIPEEVVGVRVRQSEEQDEKNGWE